MRAEKPVLYLCDAAGCSALWARSSSGGAVRDILIMQAEGWKILPSTTGAELFGVKHLCPGHVDYWHESWGRHPRGWRL